MSVDAYDALVVAFTAFPGAWRDDSDIVFLLGRSA